MTRIHRAQIVKEQFRERETFFFTRDLASTIWTLTQTENLWDPLEKASVRLSHQEYKSLLKTPDGNKSRNLFSALSSKLKALQRNVRVCDTVGDIVLGQCVLAAWCINENGN